MWKSIGKPQSVKITPKVAREFVEMETIPHDRPLSPRRLEIYKKLLSLQTFRSPEWTKCFCKSNGKTYRLNGKHTSLLFSENTWNYDVYAVVQTYEADTLEDVVRLYSTFDSRTQSRNGGDVNRAFAGSTPELQDLPSKLINDTITAINDLKKGYTSKNLSPAERAEEILDPYNIKFATWLNANVWNENKQSRHVRKSPVIAAIYATYSRNQKDATDFWQRVRDETGSSPSMPCRRLAKWLIEHPLMGGSGYTQRREYYARCINAWNMFRSDGKGNLNYYPNAKIKVV